MPLQHLARPQAGGALPVPDPLPVDPHALDAPACLHGVVEGGEVRHALCIEGHQVGPQESSYGTLGPSLLGFGKTRGSGPDMQRYVYGKIYNAKAYNLCSTMPRLGYTGTLTPEQIKDLVGLLLDPASPVNK